MKDRCVKSFNRVEANLRRLFVSVIADGALPLPSSYPNLIYEPTLCSCTFRALEQHCDYFILPDTKQCLCGVFKFPWPETR